MTYPFPMPFGGIEYKIPLTPTDFDNVMEFFGQKCYKNHYHNFAIEMDFKPDKIQIYVSALGAQCIKNLLKEIE